MIIKHPEAADLAALRGLWQEAFGDSDSFLDAFFSTVYAPERCFILRCGGEPGAMLFWMDGSCRGRQCAYLYAVATAEALRGRGLCHRLMDHTHRHLQQRGYAMAVLVPGSPALFSLYKGMGYRPFGGIREEFHTAAPEALPLWEISAEAYGAARPGLLPEGSILPDGPTLAFLQTQGRFYAGEGLLLCAHAENGTLFAPELLGSAEPGRILRALGCREGTFRRPGQDPFALWLPLADAEPPEYFSFALD